MNKLKKATLLAVILSAGLVAGCDNEEGVLRKAAEIKACTDAGGIAIRSTWDGRLADCIFPPETSN